MDPTVLAAGRAFADGILIDACTVERRGAPSTDPLDGTVTYPMSPVYTGRCRVQQAAAPWAGPATVGEAGVGLSSLQLDLPVVGSEGVTKDDVVTITACTHDADLVGRTFTVQGAHHKSLATTRRLPLLEILS